MHRAITKLVPIVACVTRVLLGTEHTVKIKTNVLIICHFVMLMPSVTIHTPPITVSVILVSKATLPTARMWMNV